jgi:hypothetical protein
MQNPRGQLQFVLCGQEPPCPEANKETELLPDAVSVDSIRTLRAQ